MKRILLVDDEQENIELLTRYLSQEGHTVQSANEGETALHRLRAWKPQLILLDVNMPGMTGLDLIPKIRAATTDDYVSIILVSGNMTMEDISKGMEAGADDYLTKPFRAQELITRVRAMLKLKDLQDSLRRATHRVEELTSTDDLTGLLNMRAMFRKGDEEIAKSRRFKKPLSALVVNLDHFSDVNQGQGFQFGTKVLQETGEKIRQCLRSIDLAARIGADEYFVLLVETDLGNAEFVAEKIRDSIQNTSYKDGKLSAKLTASIGVATLNLTQSEQRMPELINQAYEALSSAKLNGPNKIEVYSFA